VAKLTDRSDVVVGEDITGVWQLR